MPGGKGGGVDENRNRKYSIMNLTACHYAFPCTSYKYKDKFTIFMAVDINYLIMTIYGKGYIQNVIINTIHTVGLSHNLTLAESL